MNTKFKVSVLTLLVLIIILQVIQLVELNKHDEPQVIDELKVETLVVDTLALNKDNFYKVCELYEIKFPEIVYAQARLESGHFTSSVFKKTNNMLGLYDSKNKCYYSFKHWTHCLKGYHDYVQVKYEGGNHPKDYYQWLSDLPYATDTLYINKLQYLVKN
jgi:uncharacterized FlgJ-related protein